MKISKRQLRQIIREEKARLNEFGIDRMTSGDRDPRLDSDDDLSLGIETWEKITEHLQALTDLLDSEAGHRSVQQHDPEVNQIRSLLPWAQDHLDYWREE